MRGVLQRVAHASVEIDGGTPATIGPGLLLLAGFTPGDAEEDLVWMVEKVLGLRIFQDAEGKMNLSVEDTGGEVLVVSQFTLYGDTRKGRRPSFVQAAPPELAIPLYDRFVELLRERLPGKVATGQFGASMRVSLLNEGPVTLMLERGPSRPPPSTGEPGDRE